MMSEINPVNHKPVLERIAASRSGGSIDTAPASIRGGDSVEVSDAASLLSKLANLPDVRQDLVNSVRAQIDNDTYLTDDKIDAAVNEVYNDLAG